jgi:hypothetical protein
MQEEISPSCLTAGRLVEMTMLQNSPSVDKLVLESFKCENLKPAYPAGKQVQVEESNPTPAKHQESSLQ